MTSSDENHLPEHLDFLYPPRDEDMDRLMTQLMLAGEDLVKPFRSAATKRPVNCASPPYTGEEENSPDFASILSGLMPLLTQLQQNKQLNSYLAQLPAAFGDGDALRLLFEKLFQRPVGSAAMKREGKPLLTRRQLEVLREAAGDRSHKEIAERLGVTKESIDKHFTNIYRQLDVTGPMQALSRAISMGYLEMNLTDFILKTGQTAERNFSLFGTFLSCMGAIRNFPEDRVFQPIAELGLLLMLVSGVAMNLIGQDRPDQASAHRSVYLCLSPSGRIKSEQSLSGAPACLILAPPHAAQQGFKPGHLYAAVNFRPQQSLNEGDILEFSPSGQLLRSFCGAPELGTRLSYIGSLAFHNDGRLLAASGALTDAILAFSAGGSSVQRFANFTSTGIAVHASGRIYAIQHSGIGCNVRVLDPSGDTRQQWKRTSRDVYYSGIVVNEAEEVFVLRQHAVRGAIEKYNARGKLLNDFDIPHAGRHLSMDKDGRLYISCLDAGYISILTTEGAQVKRIPLKHPLQPRCIVPLEDGSIGILARQPGKTPT